jgi:hypothetical protein
LSSGIRLTVTGLNSQKKNNRGNGIVFKTGNTFFVAQSKASYRNLNSEVDGMAWIEM